MKKTQLTTMMMLCTLAISASAVAVPMQDESLSLEKKPRSHTVSFELLRQSSDASRENQPQVENNTLFQRALPGSGQ
ncbi:hypothetical protein [Alteromonas sp. CYL-A6]|uniref:hypothetical protein n=1 Tax=Alteromonas nitratireducens TaxID=3390813 RepID=UPI0034AAAFA4